MSVARLIHLLTGENGVGRVPHDGMGSHVAGHGDGLVFFLNRIINGSCGVLVVGLCCWRNKIGVVINGFRVGDNTRVAHVTLVGMVTLGRLTQNQRSAASVANLVADELHASLSRHGRKRVSSRRRRRSEGRGGGSESRRSD